MMVENLLNPTHLLMILAVAVIVLGPKRLPEAGRGFGAAIRGFKESLSAPERRDEQTAIHPSRKPDHDAQRTGSVTVPRTTAVFRPRLAAARPDPGCWRSQLASRAGALAELPCAARREMGP